MTPNIEPADWNATTPQGVSRIRAEADPLGPLPQLSRRHALLENRLARVSPVDRFPIAAFGLEDFLGPVESSSERVNVVWRASGLGRPGFIAQFSWPRLATRLALGVETQLAHAMVDRLLGATRPRVESRLQLTPVEWGILTFLLARGLDGLATRTGSLGPWDLLIDRTGPDPFDVRQLGSIVTLRWGVRVGDVDGSVRLWLPESLVALWLISEPQPAQFPTTQADLKSRRFAELAGVWRAEAGVIELPRGLGTLRMGGVLPLRGCQLQGSPQSPTGLVELSMRLSGSPERLWFTAEPVAGSGGLDLTLTSRLLSAPTPREGLALNPPTESNSPPDSSTKPLAPTEIPVTLTVELGRLNLSLSRLADLKPGDVVELGRHSREPVELTSGGRLVARGELVMIDTELGVRVTSIFL